jgi:hypothetical protein
MENEMTKMTAFTYRNLAERIGDLFATFDETRSMVVVSQGEVVDVLCEELAKGNPRFDAKRFRDAVDKRIYS